jgi:hypothetical protein
MMYSLQNPVELASAFKSAKEGGVPLSLIAFRDSAVQNVQRALEVVQQYGASPLFLHENDGPSAYVINIGRKENPEVECDLRIRSVKRTFRINVIAESKKGEGSLDFEEFSRFVESMNFTSSDVLYERPSTVLHAWKPEDFRAAGRDDEFWAEFETRALHQVLMAYLIAVNPEIDFTQAPVMPKEAPDYSNS